MYVTYICLHTDTYIWMAYNIEKKSCCSHMAKGDGIEKRMKEQKKKMEKVFFMIFLTTMIFFSFFCYVL